LSELKKQISKHQLNNVEPIEKNDNPLKTVLSLKSFIH